MKEFSASLLEPFGLRAKRVTRAYGAFICDTNQGSVLVKQTEEAEEVLCFAHGAKEHMARRGFAGTDRYLLSQEGLIWAEQAGERYTVRRWLRTEEADLTKGDCAVRMAVLLAKMHRAAAGYEADVQNFENNDCYEWPQRIYKYNRKLQNFGKMLRKNGRYTEFDLMVLEILPEAMEQAKEAQSFFMSDDFANLAQLSDSNRYVGHGNFSDHTVLLGTDQSMITDLENCAYMIPVVDLAVLLERTLRKTDWNMALGMRMIEGYDRWCPLRSEERGMIRAMLLYPERLYLVCSEAYHMKRSWMPIAYKRKLEEWQAQQGKRKEFLKQLSYVLR